MGSVFAWIVTGLLAGALARWVVSDERSGCLYTIVIGVLGALIGGALMQAIDERPLDEFSLRTVVVAGGGGGGGGGVGGPHRRTRARPSADGAP
jgi:uncharacterized membrane protein YeaQ/YmgE (transglycosylase-associated protein family)